MLHGKKIICVIPARLSSTRFPQKMLAWLAGKPLLQWVWEGARKIPFFDDLVVATDAQEIADLVRSFGGRAIMTSLSCTSGTERLVEIAQKAVFDADIWVNWQGDEPFINEAMLGELLQSCHSDEADLWTLCKKIIYPEEIADPNVAKVIYDSRQFALYFSRSTIPYYRDALEDSQKKFYKHIGLYAFTKQSLQKISLLPPTDLEEAEKLEQLRFLHHGLKIKLHITHQEVFGIDLPEHLAKAADYLKSYKL